MANIDLLIGAELLYSLLESDQIRLGEDLPILQNSRLGRLMSGPLNVPISYNIVCHVTVENSLEKLIGRFWKIEEVPQAKSYSAEEHDC